MIGVLIIVLLFAIDQLGRELVAIDDDGMQVNRPKAVEEEEE